MKNEKNHQVLLCLVGYFNFGFSVLPRSYHQPQNMGFPNLKLGFDLKNIFV